MSPRIDLDDSSDDNSIRSRRKHLRRGVSQWQSQNEDGVDNQYVGRGKNNGDDVDDEANKSNNDNTDNNTLHKDDTTTRTTTGYDGYDGDDDDAGYNDYDDNSTTDAIIDVGNTGTSTPSQQKQQKQNAVSQHGRSLLPDPSDSLLSSSSKGDTNDKQKGTSRKD